MTPDSHPDLNSEINAQLDALLFDNGSHDVASARIASSNSPENSIPHRSIWRDEIDRWRERHKAFKVSQRGIWISRRRCENRAQYAAIKAAQGKAVRPYVRSGIRQEKNECANEFLLRRDRELKRKRYHAKIESEGKSVRQYTPLCELTLEQIAEHKRLQNAEAARRSRAKRKSDNVGGSSSSTLPKKPHTFRV